MDNYFNFHEVMITVAKSFIFYIKCNVYLILTGLGCFWKVRMYKLRISYTER